MAKANNHKNTPRIAIEQVKRLRPYWELMRFHRPVGILLLLWPTLWALWIAAQGVPDISVLIIFVLGVVLMRAAGCVINDIADRKWDGKVLRTRSRPLVTGAVTVKQAWLLFASLIILAFILVLFTNRLTILLAFVAVGLAACYPFMKRYTHLPQVVLGAAFSMSIPMAFAAQTGSVEPRVMLIYVTSMLWTVVYDTFYGMADREYDKKIGVKSTAILFEGVEFPVTASLQAFTIVGFVLMSQRFELGGLYWLGVIAAAGLMVYHQRLIAKGQPSDYFAAFAHNHWIGCVIFVGIALYYI